MGQATAISGAGTLFKRGNGATPTELFTTLAQCLKISWDGPTKQTIETTNQDSGQYRSYIAGWRDAGEIKLTVNFTLASHFIIWGDFNSDVTHNYQIVLPDTGNTTFQAAAHITNMPLTAPVDDRVTYDITLKLTGVPTLTS